MQHINSFSGGMKSGLDYTLMPQDSYTYMLNGYFVSKDNHGYIITSIKGDAEIASFGVNECPIGSVTFNGVLYIITHCIEDDASENIKFYSLKGSEGNGWVDDMLILPWSTNGYIISTTVLGFTRGKLLEVFAKQSYDGSVDLYICDGLNPNVIINTGLDNDGNFTGRQYDNFEDKSLFSFQKSINTIPYVVTTVKSGGNMKPGTYYFYVRYLDDSLNATPFIKEVGPIFIHAGTTTRKNVSGVLNENEARVNKQVELVISNNDPQYSKVSIGVVYYFGTDGLLSRENYLIHKTYSINNNSNYVAIIDGNNEVESLLLESLLADNSQYDTCETIQQFEERFHGANWKSKALDYDELATIAGLIIPHAVLKETDNFDEVYDQDKVDFEYMENEIYPFGVSFLIDGKFKTPVFPICGWYEGEQNEFVLPTENLTFKLLTEDLWSEEIPAVTEEQEVRTTPDPIELPANDIFFEIDINDSLNLLCTSTFPLTEDLIITGVINHTNLPQQSFTVTLTELSSTLVSVATLSEELANLEQIVITEFSPTHNGYPCDLDGLQVGVLDRWKDATHYYRYFGTLEYPEFPIEITEQDVVTIEIVEITPAIPSELISEAPFTSDFEGTLVQINNNLGLFKFPSKKYIDDLGTDENILHQRLMGVEMVYDYARAYLDTLDADFKARISEIYIMQGERLVNTLFQGVMCAAVEAIGFSASYPCNNNVQPPADYFTYKQNTKLGDGTNNNAFPWFDGSNLRRFPVIRLARHQNTSSKAWEFIIQENAVTEMMVKNTVEDYEASTSLVIEHNYIDESDLLGWSNDFLTDFEVETDKFCIFSPDIIMRNISIPEECFIKPMFKFSIPRNTDDTYEDIYTKYSSLCGGPAIPGDLADVDHLAVSEYKDTFATNRLLQIDIENYVKSLETDLGSVLCQVINENEISSGFFGFSSRMKSIFDVYGPEMASDERRTDISYNLPNVAAYFASNRKENKEAGILINRFLKDTDNNLIANPNVSTDTADAERSRRFGTEGRIFSSDSDTNSLPVVCTNLSMKTSPYLAVKTTDKIGYTGINNEFHNSIVNVCKYNSIQDYIDAEVEAYNILDEQYNIISNEALLAVDATQHFKGDLFSQKTFMRTVRWNSLPQSMNSPEVGLSDWDFAWKQGQAFNIYLQSFCNTYLRVKGFDDTFYPFVLNNTDKTLQTIVEDFVWSETSNEFLKETWTSNAGYEQLKSLFKLPAFDDLFSNISSDKKNRIYFSYKNIDGSFIDQYRSLILNQYRDYGFEFGEIKKLVKFNSTLFSIQQSAINQHFTSSDNSIVDDNNIGLLNAKYRQLADFGTQHKESITVGANGIYGIDWNKETIWRIKPATTTSGSIVFGVENLEILKINIDVFKQLKSYVTNSELPQNTLGTNASGIISTYDELNKQILFTFILGEYAYYNFATTLHPRWNDSGSTSIFGTDRFGFGALANALRNFNGAFDGAIGDYFTFWTSSRTVSGYIPYNASNIGYEYSSDADSAFRKPRGFAVRAVRTATPTEQLLPDGLISATYTDIDGNIYQCTKIGLQVWTTSNLKVTKYADGTPIPTNLSNAAWTSDTVGACAVYGKADGAYVPVDELATEADMVAAYGRLYNWYAVTNVKKLVSDVDGWHVPSDEEFTQLTDYLIATYPDITVDNVGDVLKSTRQVNSSGALYKNRIITLSFSEMYDFFVGYLSYEKNSYLKFDNRLLSYSMKNKKLMEHNVGEYMQVEGEIVPFVISFVINGMSEQNNVVQFEKEFLSHILNSSPQDITSIKWETEYQSSTKEPFINATEFWSNPEYKEHNWNIPIGLSQITDGPKSETAFETFEIASKMRGQWIKVTITYLPTENDNQEHQFYIRSLITNFLISFN